MSAIDLRPSRGYARLNCRVDAQIKRRAEEAASLLGQSITDFTEAALAEKAQAVLEEHVRIVLSERDFQRFVQKIENPEPPTLELKKAMAEYRHLQTARLDANL